MEQGTLELERPPAGEGLARGAWAALCRAVPAGVALAAYCVLMALVVIAAPSARPLVPIGAPGSTLPDWILGPLAPLSAIGLQEYRGATEPLFVLLVAICVFVVPLAWLRVVDGAHEIDRRTLIRVVLGLYVLLVIAPPLLSTDVFTYLSGGRLQVLHGVNPYLHGPVVRPDDQIFGWTGLIWLDTPTVYGPLFTLLTAALSPLGPVAGLWLLKVLTGACAVACVWLTGSIASLLGRDPVRAALFVALNPLFTVYTLAGAHNDLLALALALLATWMVLALRPRLAGAGLAAAVAVKATAGLALPFLIVGASRRERKGGWAVTVGFLVISVLIGLVATVFYGPHWLSIPASIADGTAQHIGELRSIPGFLAGYTGLGPIGSLARNLLFIGVVTVVAFELVRSLRTRNGWVDGIAVSSMALLVLSTQLHPNYIAMALPFAAVAGDRRIRWFAVALTLGIIAINVIRSVLPLGVGWPHGG